MDPSEFEDTVPKNEDILDAGTLELLLPSTASHSSKYQYVDLTSTIGDLYLSIYNLKENLSKYEDVALDVVLNEITVNYNKLLTMKDEYVGRRKQLTIKVKQYISTYLDGEVSSYRSGISNSEDHLSSSDRGDLIEESRQLIDHFKLEFDFLSNLTKYAEKLFHTVYNILKEYPDPIPLLTANIEVCLKSQDALTRTNEQFSIAHSIITMTLSNGDSSSSMGFNQQQQQQQHDELINELNRKHDEHYEQLKASYQAELARMHAMHESERRKQEQMIIDHYTKQQLELQNRCDVVLTKKEGEVESLLRDINEYQVKGFEYEERARLLDLEIKQRRDLEDKWRASVMALSELNSTHQDTKSQLERVTIELNSCIEKLEQVSKQYESFKYESQREEGKLMTKVAGLEEQLRLRPPVDLEKLFNKVGSISNVDRDGDGDGDDSSSGSGSGSLTLTGGGATSTSNKVISWIDLESFLIDSLRKSSSSLIHSRLKEQEHMQRLNELSADNASLKNKIAHQSEEIETLEKDLLFLQAKPNMHQHNHALPYPLSDASLRTPSASSINDPFSLANHHHNNNHYGGLSSDDVKSGVTGDTSSGSSTGRIISAIQGQRDRYMKASQDKEATLLVMKQRSDQMEDELMQLRNENMELFRRLRVLRVNQGQGNSSSGSSSSSSSSRYIHSISGGGSEQIDRDDPNLMQLPSSAIYSSKVGVYTDSRCNPNHGVNTATSSSSSSSSSSSNSSSSISSSSSNNSSGGIWNAIRSRRFNLMGGGGGGGGSLLSGEGDGEGELLSDDGTTHGGYDPLHEKYMGLYEQDISPFRIQQLDRQLALSRLNVFERGLAFINQNIMQDRWSRNALLLYLLLVHAFALLYAWEVLNPQLIDEVNAHLKAKWSAETFSMQEHPDI